MILSVTLNGLILIKIVTDLSVTSPSISGHERVQINRAHPGLFTTTGARSEETNKKND